VLAEDQVRPPPRQIAIPVEVSALTVILALVLALLAGAGAALYQHAKPTKYVSYAVLLIDQPVAVASDTGDSTLAKLQRLRYYYAGLLTTEVIASPVAQQLGLPVGTVEGSLSTLIGASTFTIDIIGQGANPSQSDDIAQAATSQLITYVRQQQAKIGIPVIARVTLTEVTNPRAGVKVSVSTKKLLISAAVAFVVVGVAFLIVADLLRRRW
jgi:hypothetical protein